MEHVQQRSRLRIPIRIRNLLRVLVVTYLAMVIGCAALQRSMIYHPNKFPSDVSDRLAASAGLERWKSLTGENIGWKRLAELSNAHGVAFLTHGNAGSAIDRSDYAKAIQQVLGMDVFILEYPGFGDRSGQPSEQSLFRVADEGFASLPTNRPIYVVGESLGTGVATYIAGGHQDNVAGVLLVASYNNLADVGQYHIPILPVRWLLQDRFQSEKFLSNYYGPVAMLLAGKDSIVPPRFGHRLFESYTGPKRLWEFPQDTHESIHGEVPACLGEIATFWRAHKALAEAK